MSGDAVATAAETVEHLHRAMTWDLRVLMLSNTLLLIAILAAVFWKRP